MIRFRVNGRPAPQGSKRHVGGGRMVESSRAVGPWREAVRAETQRQLGNWTPLKDVPLVVDLEFMLPRPRSHYGTGRNASKVLPSAPPHPSRRPDLDKLTRAVLDGLTEGGAFADDAQVVWLNVSKHWCRELETPGTIICIKEA